MMFQCHWQVTVIVAQQMCAPTLIFKWVVNTIPAWMKKKTRMDDVIIIASTVYRFNRTSTKFAYTYKHTSIFIYLDLWINICKRSNNQPVCPIHGFFANYIARVQYIAHTSRVLSSGLRAVPFTTCGCLVWWAMFGYCVCVYVARSSSIVMTLVVLLSFSDSFIYLSLSFASAERDLSKGIMQEYEYQSNFRLYTAWHCLLTLWTGCFFSVC